jgi:hypothetical protein
MAAIMDVVFSMILGGLLLLVVIDANEIASENQSLYNGNMLVQELLITTAQMIEGEFRNMGFGVPETTGTIISADTSEITFLIDLDRNDTIDTVSYGVGPAAELSSTQNELDRYLYRSVNYGPTFKIGVVTVFNLQYFTRAGETLSTPVQGDRLPEIHVVEVTLEVQNPYALLRKESHVQTGERNALYSSSLWQQTRLSSQNSRR